MTEKKLDAKLEEFYERFVSQDFQIFPTDLSSKISSKCEILRRQRSDLERLLSESSPASVFTNINFQDLLGLAKQFDHNEDLNVIQESESKLPLRQKLLRALERIDTQKIETAQEEIGRVKIKISNLRSLLTLYKGLEAEQNKNPGEVREVLQKLIEMKKLMKDFDNEDLQTKLFKHLKKKIDMCFETQTKNFEIHLIPTFFSYIGQTIAFNKETIQDFFFQIPEDFHHFRNIFINTVKKFLNEKLKMAISPDCIEITILRATSEMSDEEKRILPYSKIEFDAQIRYFPQEEKNFTKYLTFVEEFFQDFFNNLTIFNQFSPTEKHIDIFTEQILDFLKTLNLKVFDQNNRLLLSQKIKALEKSLRSREYFTRDFFIYFENIQNTELYENQKTNLIELKNSLCFIFKKIGAEPSEKTLYIELFEKVKLQIQVLEKNYLMLENINQELTHRHQLLSLFLSDFQLILELMKIFEESIAQPKGLFCHSWISLLNLVQKGINNFTEFLISKVKIKDKKILSSIFNINRTIMREEIRFRTKIEVGDKEIN